VNATRERGQRLSGASKGGRPRVVPPWWDAGTLEDLVAWKADRLRAGAEYDDPFLASLIPGRALKPFSRHTLRKPFRTACKLRDNAAVLVDTASFAVLPAPSRRTFGSHRLECPEWFC
jgi:hypothetical protein